ncbi:NirD/YgiW/YdeI family stress tolerance protein [Pseudodesulfovibrio sp.]|uniref:NirD/YgiW/YdeI family stress tolerance protein n=1 Tax=unclassified Pseudodesulfovibrio TaxID=2661612 RepID=UPI003B008302
MRRFTTILTMAMLVASFALVAQQGFAAGHPVSTSVEDAKASGVDTDVRLSGVVKHINNDEYLLADGTGELLVYISDSEQQKLADAGKPVEIKGNIVRNFMYTEVQAVSVAPAQVNGTSIASCE